MPQFPRMSRAASRVRMVLAPALAIAALALTTPVSATSDSQAKPELKVEGQRSPLGAKLTFTGSNWTPKTKITLTGTRAPGASGTQKFGNVTTDSTGSFTHRFTADCTTTDINDARESVTVTADDGAGNKVTAKVDGSSWMCQQ